MLGFLESPKKRVSRCPSCGSDIHKVEIDNGEQIYYCSLGCTQDRCIAVPVGQYPSKAANYFARMKKGHT